MVLTCGRSGSGKSALSSVHAVGAWRAGEAVVVVDPHRTMIEDVAGYVSGAVRLSVSRGVEPVESWNPMVCESAEGVSQTVEDVVDAVAGAMGWTERNTRAQTFLSGAVGALVEASVAVDVTPTLFEVVDFLTDESFRERVCRHVSAWRREWIERDYGRYSSDAVMPVVQPLRRMRAVDSYAKVLGQPRPGLDIGRVIEDGGVLLVSLSGTGQSDQLIASMFLHRLMSVVLSGSGRPVRVFMDEAQSYEASAGGVIRGAVEQGRKFGLRAHLIVQQPSRLTKATLRSLLENRSAAFVGGLGVESAKRMAAELGHPWETIHGLDQHRMLADVTVDGCRRGPWLVETATPEMVFGAPSSGGRVAGKPLEGPPSDVAGRLLRQLEPRGVRETSGVRRGLL